MPGVGQKDTNSQLETSPLPPEAAKRVVLLDLDDLRKHLAQLAKESGGNAELGRRLGVTGQFVDYLIKGQRNPGKKALAALGARRRVMIEIEL